MTRGRRALGLAVRVAITALLLVWLFRHAGGWQPVLTALRSARPGFILAAFFANLAIQVTIAHRLRLLARVQGVGLGTGEVVEINLVTLFYGLFLPGGGMAAILIRFYRLTRDDRRYAATLAAIVCDRLLATATLSVAGLIFWLLDGPQRLPQALLVLVVSTAVTALGLWPMLHPAPARWIGPFAARLPLARTLWPRLADALALFRAIPLSGQLRLAALSIGAHVLGIAVYFLLAGGLGLSVPFVALGWMRSIAMLVAILPFSISGLGLREGAMVALLGQRGVPGDAAVGYALLVFAITILSVALVGGLIEAYRWFRPRPR